jgi:hypothetical protein
MVQCRHRDNALVLVDFQHSFQQINKVVSINHVGHLIHLITARWFGTIQLDEIIQTLQNVFPRIFQLRRWCPQRINFDIMLFLHGLQLPDSLTRK